MLNRTTGFTAEMRRDAEAAVIDDAARLVVRAVISGYVFKDTTGIEAAKSGLKRHLRAKVAIELLVFDGMHPGR